MPEDPTAVSIFSAAAIVISRIVWLSTVGYNKEIRRILNVRSINIAEMTLDFNGGLRSSSTKGEQARRTIRAEGDGMKRLLGQRECRQSRPEAA